MMLQIENVSPIALSDIVKAISSFVSASQIKLFEDCELPAAEDEGDHEFEQIAQAVAAAVRPTGRQSMRQEALNAALRGWDSLNDQEGEADPSMRNALGALSKAMRPLFPYDPSPIDRLATRTKRFDSKGNYLATVYSPTKLGIRVREILEADNAL